jgi:2,4-diketo-3-deoxy-L-fuconate hydrolase
MLLCRFNKQRLGVVVGDVVYDVTEALDILPCVNWPLPVGDMMIGNIGKICGRIADILPGAKGVSVKSVSLYSPVANPPKIVGAPVNYREHIAEAERDKETFFQHQLVRIREIGLFLKSTTSLSGPAEGVSLRYMDRRTDHEVELAVVIGKMADRVNREDALNYVAGYTIGLDMTCRGREERSLRKSIDSYSVLGPWLATSDEIPNPGILDLELSVNGELRQKANTRDLIMDVSDLIAFASSFYTLLPGDVIMTGTPAGVGPVMPGDVIRARIEKIGEMDVVVKAA